jgi:outer membrane protein OmpA-like peptidoglycan-associated protein
MGVPLLSAAERLSRSPEDPHMPRLRIAILPLFTALVVPAFGETATSSCPSWNASYCEAEFAQARNAEIDVSIAAVKAAREHAFVEARNAEIDASVLAVKMTRLQPPSRSGCESADASLAPCEGEVAANFARERNAEIDASIAAVAVERERRFAQARNAEIEASILTVKAARESEFALRRTRCESPEANLAPCEGEVAANFAKARNAEIDASIAAVAVERERRFAQARNAEITASIATVKAARESEFAEARTAEMLAWVSAIRGDRTQRFAQARNAEIDASIAAVKAARQRDLALSVTHCKSADAETPRCEAERAREFAAARNAEINASIALADAARDRRFAEARNAEIDAALSAYRAERMIRTAKAQTPPTIEPSIETGAIRVPEVPVEPILPLRRSIGTEPCPAAGIRLTPIQFSGPGATVDDAVKPGLDTIAAIARGCPAVHIEIHGYSDTSAASNISQLLSELRAKAAMAYLESVGVAANRMIAFGHGDMIPLAANTTPENRAQNRRVEFTIKDPALQSGVKRVMWDLSELLDPTYVPQLARLSP